MRVAATNRATLDLYDDLPFRWRRIIDIDLFQPAGTGLLVSPQADTTAVSLLRIDLHPGFPRFDNDH
jgi:hypothetical protein